MTLLKNLLSNSDILAFFGILLSLGMSFYILKKDTYTPIIKERYEQFICPLFTILEPHLFNKTIPQDFDKLLSFIDENKIYADGKLLEIHYHCREFHDHESFIELCSYIDKYYDRYCRQLKIKQRSMFYRFERHQYKNVWFVVHFCFVHTILFILILATFIISMATVVTLATLAYEQANDELKLLFLIITGLLFIILFKFINRHI